MAEISGTSRFRRHHRFWSLSITRFGAAVQDGLPRASTVILFRGLAPGNHLCQ